MGKPRAANPAPAPAPKESAPAAPELEGTIPVSELEDEERQPLRPGEAVTEESLKSKDELRAKFEGAQDAAYAKMQAGQGEKPAAPADDDEEAEVPAAPAPADDKGREKRRARAAAEQTLRLTGLYDDDDLEKMGEAELSRLAERARQRRAEQTKANQARAQARGQTPAGTGTDAGHADGTPREASPPPGTQRRTPDPADAEPDPLDELLGVPQERRETAPRATPPDPSPEVQRLERQLFSERYQAARSALQTDFPAVAEPSVMEQVDDEMAELDPQGLCARDPELLRSLMRRACKVVFSEQLQAEARRPATDRPRAALNGQPLAGLPKTGSGARTQAGRVDRSDKEAVQDAAYATLDQAKSQKERRALLSKQLA